jgi:hypothetical protein
MKTESSTPVWKIVELSGDFRPCPTGKKRSLAERHSKIRKISATNTSSMKSPEFHGTDCFLAVLSDLGTSQHITLDATVEFHLLISSK